MEDVSQVKEEEQQPKSAIEKARERAAEVRRKKNLDTEPVVVVEQSDSDSEELEGPPNVIFVRRKREKKPQPKLSTMTHLLHTMYGENATL